tara:strand:+ start:1598 stop:2311 length:714 start_codon:yes stop_codon:yes gene_type:complete
MLKFKKIFILSQLILILLFISCGDSADQEPIQIKEFEYLGYEFLDNKIVIYTKNYNAETQNIKVNSSTYSEIIQEENYSEMTFDNKGNSKANLKIELEGSLVSKLLVNPKTEFTQRNINNVFDIKINETIFIEETSTTLTLIDVAEDSRCPDPKDNNTTTSNPGSCIHKPKTLIHMKMSSPKYPQFDEFFYKEQLSDYSFFYGGNNFSIIEISPEILELNRLVPKNDYSVTMLSKVN